MRFFVIMFTLAPPSIKTFSIIFFPTCIWIIAISLSTSIVVVFSSECVSTTMATLGFNICLVFILVFLVSIYATYIFKDLVPSSAIDLTSKYK